MYSIIVFVLWKQEVNKGSNEKVCKSAVLYIHIVGGYLEYNIAKHPYICVRV